MVNCSLDPRVRGGSVVLGAAWLISFFFNIPSLTWFLFILLMYHLSFFRDPKPYSAKPHELLSPASGTVVDITLVSESRFLKTEAVRVGIFLSLFDAHVNRSPLAGRISYFSYEPGKFLNAMKPESSRENESVWIGLEGDGRKILIRLISGAIARRICCDVQEKQDVTQAEKLGIIRYGSRAELFVPKEHFNCQIRLGQKVAVGRTLLGEWK